MTIRTKLAASLSALLIVSLSALGFGVLFVSRQFNDRDTSARVEVIESSVQRAALDALLQKDDLALISYVNFLKGQYPALAYARMNWQIGERTRALSVGGAPAGKEITEKAFQVVDPANAGRRVGIVVGIDQASLREYVGQDERRLTKIITGVSSVTILVGMLFSIWFSSSLTAPLSALVRVAGEVGAGRFGASLEWESDDEVGSLVKVFNGMSQKLEELDESKKTFVSSVTHELRSPLGAIESFLHLVEEKLKAPDAAGAAQSLEYVGRIQANVQRLGRFINDLLDVAKIEKGKMECVLRPIKLQEVASEVCQFFEPKARAQEVRLGQSLDALPAVMGDSERLRQVLVNLVSNGLKFTPPGGRIEILGEQYREGVARWVEVAVVDTGRGMDESDTARLFSAFSQGRNVGEGVIGAKGTGLGLYIAKSIIDQHGGKIAVKSSRSEGTRIVFSLKVAG
ncbi:MAG: HAMP domain-containing protein [Elusimicrobia bacterium]|nr:HAMP domain-containing protein [Elusimicrobiota bacterium]